MTYSQLNSPKLHPVVRECRGIVLDLHNLDTVEGMDGSSRAVVCLPFDRFLSYGEHGTEHLTDTEMTFYPKHDGSLIKIYCHRGTWLIGSKSTAISNGEVAVGSDVKFPQLVHMAMGLQTNTEFQYACNRHLTAGLTYLFEVTSPLNRVITPYNDHSLIWLAVRDLDGEYYDYEFIQRCFEGFPASFHAPLPFKTVKEAQAAANELRGMKEGFVGYVEGEPVLKVKSRLYVQAHHVMMDGEDHPGNAAVLSKRVLAILLINEQDEYLAHFPETQPTFSAHQLGLENLKAAMTATFAAAMHITDPKLYADAIRSFVYSKYLFYARNNGTTPWEEWNKLDVDSKLRFLLKYQESAMGVRPW